MTLFYNEATQFSKRITTSTVVLASAVGIKTTKVFVMTVSIPRRSSGIAHHMVQQQGVCFIAVQKSLMAFEKSAKLLKCKRRTLLSTLNVRNFQLFS